MVEQDVDPDLPPSTIRSSWEQSDSQSSSTARADACAEILALVAVMAPPDFVLIDWATGLELIRTPIERDFPVNKSGIPLRAGKIRVSGPGQKRINQVLITWGYTDSPAESDSPLYRRVRELVLYQGVAWPERAGREHPGLMDRRRVRRRFRWEMLRYHLP